MLVKKTKPHIDIRDKGSDYHGELAMPSGTSKAKKPDPRGPMVHITNVELPLNDTDVNNSGTAQIKYVLRKKSTGNAYGNPSKDKSYDIEITHIKFGSEAA